MHIISSVFVTKLSVNKSPDESDVCTFSNGSSNAVSKLLMNADTIDILDGIVSAEGVQVFKPSPLVYEHFNKQTNSTKSDSIFDPWGIDPTTTINGIAELSLKLN